MIEEQPSYLVAQFDGLKSRFSGQAKGKDEDQWQVYRGGH